METTTRVLNKNKIKNFFFYMMPPAFIIPSLLITLILFDLFARRFLGINSNQVIEIFLFMIVASIVPSWFVIKKYDVD